MLSADLFYSCFNFLLPIQHFISDPRRKTLWRNLLLPSALQSIRHPFTQYIDTNIKQHYSESIQEKVVDSSYFTM